MALKRTKLEQWQRNDERLERLEKAAAESENDEQPKPVREMAAPKAKAAAA